MATLFGIAWESPATFETEIVTDGEVDLALAVLSLDNDPLWLRKHNPEWPDWLALDDLGPPVNGRSVARLHGTLPAEGDYFEALIRATDNVSSADRTVRIYRKSMEAVLSWDLDWPAPNGIVALPPVREGDDYSLHLALPVGARLTLAPLGAVTAELADNEQEGFPRGLYLNGTTGEISGVTTDVAADQSFLFMIRAIRGSSQIERRFRLLVQNAADGLPRWITPAGSVGILSSGQETEIALEAQARNPGDTLVFALAAGSTLPDGLSVTGDGRIVGTAAPVSELSETFFGIAVRKLGDITDRVRRFSLTVLSSSTQGVVQWITPSGGVGNIVEETPSELLVRASLPEQPDLPVWYRVGTPTQPPQEVGPDDVRAALPVDLDFQTCHSTGLITGRPGLTTAGRHDIAVRAYVVDDQGLPFAVSAIRPFSFTVTAHYGGDGHLDVFVPLTGPLLATWRAWNTKELIPDEMLWRPCDIEHGRRTEPRMFVMGGLSMDASDPLGSLLAHELPDHRPFEVALGEPEIGAVRDAAGAAVAEVIWLPVTTRTEGQAWNADQPPGLSIGALRQELRNEVGRINDVPELLPRWMHSQQVMATGQSIVDFRAGFVIAYVAPGNGDRLLRRWQQIGPENPLSGRQFMIDRYIVEVVRPGGLPMRTSETMLFLRQTYEGPKSFTGTFGFERRVYVNPALVQVTPEPATITVISPEVDHPPLPQWGPYWLDTADSSYGLHEYTGTGWVAVPQSRIHGSNEPWHVMYGVSTVLDNQIWPSQNDKNGAMPLEQGGSIVVNGTSIDIFPWSTMADVAMAISFAGIGVVAQALPWAIRLEMTAPQRPPFILGGRSSIKLLSQDPISLTGTDPAILGVLGLNTPRMDLEPNPNVGAENDYCALFRVADDDMVPVDLSTHNRVRIFQKLRNRTVPMQDQPPPNPGGRVWMQVEAPASWQLVGSGHWKHNNTTPWNWTAAHPTAVHFGWSAPDLKNEIAGNQGYYIATWGWNGIGEGLGTSGQLPYNTRIADFDWELGEKVGNPKRLNGNGLAIEVGTPAFRRLGLTTWVEKRDIGAAPWEETRLWLVHPQGFPVSLTGSQPSPAWDVWGYATSIGVHGRMFRRFISGVTQAPAGLMTHPNDAREVGEPWQDTSFLTQPDNWRLYRYNYHQQAWVRQEDFSVHHDNDLTGSGIATFAIPLTYFAQNTAPIPGEPYIPEAIPVADLPFNTTGSVAEGEVHWFWFRVGSDVNVRISTEGSDFDTMLALFNADGDFIADDDDGGEGATSLIEDEQPLQAGFYYVAVMGYGASFGDQNFAIDAEGTESGDYLLSITAAI